MFDLPLHRDFNTPKIVADDTPVFLGLISDLFPNLDVPRKRYTLSCLEKTHAKKRCSPHHLPHVRPPS